MLERMNEVEVEVEDWYDDGYGVYVAHELVKDMEGYRAESVMNYLNEEVSEYFCGQVSITTYMGRVIDYDYITEDANEVEFFDQIKERINQAIERYKLLH